MKSQRRAEVGNPVVLAGPSGVGKSSIFQRVLAQREDCVLSISATTRPPRGAEKDGEHYFFLDVPTFEARIAAGEFIEYAKVFDRDYYGTPRSFIEQQTAQGVDVLLDIDVQGAAQLRQQLPQVVLIFLAPPNMAELERRLRDRATDSDEAISRRLATAQQELACLPSFDYCVVNDDIDRAVAEVHAIITASRLRVSLQGPR